MNEPAAGARNTCAGGAAKDPHANGVGKGTRSVGRLAPRPQAMMSGSSLLSSRAI